MLVYVIYNQTYLFIYKFEMQNKQIATKKPVKNPF